VTDRRKERATARGFGATCSLWRGPGRLGLHALNQPPEARRQSIWRQPSPAEASSKPDEEDRDLDDKGGGLNCFGEHAGRYAGARTALHEFTGVVGKPWIHGVVLRQVGRFRQGPE
jgi:hypothetical protein